MYVFSIFYVFRYLQMHMCTLAFGVAKEKKTDTERKRERENESIDIRYIYSCFAYILTYQVREALVV